MPSAEAIYAHHHRGRVRVSLAQLRMLLDMWCAVTPCTTRELTVRGVVATTVRTLRILENKRLVRSQSRTDPDTGRPVAVYDLTATGHALVADLVTTTPTTTPPERHGHPKASTPADRNTVLTNAPQTAVPNRPTSSVSEVLNFFEKCPRCGYAATATRTIREHEDGPEVMLHPTCGLPCGWNGPVRRIRGAARR